MSAARRRDATWYFVWAVILAVLAGVLYFIR